MKRVKQRFSKPKPQPKGPAPKGKVWNEDYGWVESLKRTNTRKTKAQKRAARLKKLNAALGPVVYSSGFETNRRKH
jgi:hypothetical protein